MRVLYLVTGARCGHDYGVDGLYHGLRQLPDVEVFDWPQKSSLHCPADRNGLPIRDGCEIDSDQAWPIRPYQLGDVINCDVAVLAVSFPLDPCIVGQIKDTCRAIPKTTPIVAVDYSDIVDDMRCYYEGITVRELAAYFKRELPIGKDWGIPLPLCYPEVPIVQIEERRPVLFYRATDHGGGAPGIPRRMIVSQLCQLLDDNQLDVALYPSQQNRPSPEQYNASKSTALVGISWNGAPNFDNNRLWSNFAFGLAQVSEKPRIQIPNEPQDGVHCLYVTEAEQVAGEAAALLRDIDRAREMAVAGHEHFVRWHSSKARARYFMDAIRRCI